MKSHKLTQKDSLKFIFAGNSVFTVENTKTGNRFTFKVKISKTPGFYFVSVLTSPDTYSYIGIIVNGLFTWGKKSHISENAQSVKVFQYILDKVKTQSLPEFVEIWHEGRCGKCGKTLTVPSSIQNGLGPECIKTLSKQAKRDKFLELILS